MSRICLKCHRTKFKLTKPITTIISLLTVLNSPRRNSVSFCMKTDSAKNLSTDPVFCLEFFEIAIEISMAGKNGRKVSSAP